MIFLCIVGFARWKGWTIVHQNIQIWVNFKMFPNINPIQTIPDRGRRCLSIRWKQSPLQCGKNVGSFNKKKNNIALWWFALVPSAMGTQFWVRWGPNGDHRQHKWGPKKRIFKNLSKRAYYLQFHVQEFEYLSTKLNSTDMLAWDSLKLVLSLQVFKWSTFNRQWDHYRVLHSGPLGPGCCNGENPDF